MKYILAIVDNFFTFIIYIFFIVGGFFWWPLWIIGLLLVIIGKLEKK